jgi:hypothetical protein
MKQGDGSFGAPIIAPIPTLPSNGAWVALIFHPLTDLNGDGIADLIVIEGHTGSGYVKLGDGHGKFTKSSSITGYGEPQAIDVNGDGKVDLLFSGGGIWLGKGDGTFTAFASGFSIMGNCISMTWRVTGSQTPSLVLKKQSMVTSLGVPNS